ncbi:MAG: replication factor C small subunit, partial [Harvfovirus sp.]
KMNFSHRSKRVFNDAVFVARSLGWRVDVVGENNAIMYKTIGKRQVNLTYDIRVELLEENDYAGFELDGNGRFLLGDFTVTHNTSMVMACARKLYGDKMDLMMLNINASEERGIEVVRNRIQQFVNAKIIHSENNRSVFKLVILDEADAMTSDAQAMLRKVIEKYSYCTRFCLICNYIKKISPALQSRCVCYRFPPLKAEDIKGKVLKIAAMENVDITSKGIDTIIKRSKGDMRKVLNILQSTSMSYDKITELAVNKCIGYPTADDIDKIFNSLLEDIFEDSYKLILDIKNKNSYSLQDIVTEVSEVLINMVALPKKSVGILRITTILVSLGEIEYNLTTCVTESLQLSALVGIFKTKYKQLKEYQ